LDNILNELPTTSLEGITGTWSPAINNTVTTTYTFTPNAEQCATTATMTIVVKPTLLPTNILLSPEGKLETVFDRFGNKYRLEDVNTAPKPNVTNKTQMLSSTVLCSSGIFDLYFEAGSGMEGNTTAEIDRRNVVCQVFSDLSNFINSPLHNVGNTTRVKIWVRDITQIPNVNTATLGLATGFYNVPTSPTVVNGGIADNEMWKTIHAGVDSYTNVQNPIIGLSSIVTSGSFYHGMIAINSAANWNTNLSLNALASENDLYTVVLSEVTHALGFASLIDFDGNSKLGTAYKYYSRYDTFLNYNSTKLISPSNSGCSMYDYTFSGDPATLHPGCGSTPPVNNGTLLDHTVCTNAINYIGTNTIPVYTPSCFEHSSSLSNFEDECFINPSTILPYGNNNYFVMSNTTNLGGTKRYLKPEERSTLCDLGYNLKSQYGDNTIAQNSFYDYGTGASCQGISVAGINDGINGTNYTYIANLNQNFTFTGILNNDVSYNNDYTVNNYSNLRFECLQDVYDSNAMLSSNGNSISSVITFRSAVHGLHLLRYIPYDVVTGQRGNITYVYVYVKHPSLCGTFPVCDLVINGGFEDHIPSLPTNSTIDLSQACYWYPGKGPNSGAEYFTADNTTLVDYGVPNNMYGSQNVNISINPPGHAYAGIYCMRNIFYDWSFNQVIATKLKTPLSANTTYQLTFQVSLAENISQNPIKFQAYIGQESPSPLNSPYTDLPTSATGILLKMIIYLLILKTGKL